MTRFTRVMIVDDHPLVRHGLTELLSAEPDLEVCAEAEEAGEAINMVEKLNPDVMVIDISLKRGNGIELIKHVRSRHPSVKMLVSSMHDEALFAERALRAGAMGYLNKQESTDKVVEAIRQVLNGEVFLSKRMATRLFNQIRLRGSPATQSTIESLSDRELEVFQMIGQGYSTREIADKLQLSVKTIESHREHIKAKLSIATSAKLSQHAVQWVLEHP